MSRLEHDDFDSPDEAVDAALTDFDWFQKLKDKAQARRDRIENAQNEEDLYDDDSED
jgi:hypothetical protein